MTKAERENLDTATKLAEKEKEKVTHMEEQDNLYKLHGASEREILKLKEKQIEAAIATGKSQIAYQDIVDKAQIRTARRNHEILAGLIYLTALPLKALTGSIDAIAEKFGKHLNLTKYVDDGINSVADILFDPKAVEDNAAQANEEAQRGIKALENQLAGFKLQERELNKKAAAEARDFQKELTSIKNDGDYARITDSTELAQRQLADQYRAQQEEINASERT